MTALYVIGGVIALIILVACIPAKPRTDTPGELADALQLLIDGKGGDYFIDDYFGIAYFPDARMEEIRMRVLSLPNEFPEKGRYCSEAGLNVLREYILELRKIPD